MEEDIKTVLYSTDGGIHHGYKEYVCILIKNNRIISVEFNAKDYSGYIKSWDNGYMNRMKKCTGNISK